MPPKRGEYDRQLLIVTDVTSYLKTWSTLVAERIEKGLTAALGLSLAVSGRVPGPTPSQSSAPPICCSSSVGQVFYHTPVPAPSNAGMFNSVACARNQLAITQNGASGSVSKNQCP